MKEFFGTAINGGVAEGSLYVFSHNKCPVRRYHIEDSSGEINRFEKARAEAKADLERLFEKTVSEIGELDAGVFSAQIDILDDDAVIDSVYDIITDQLVNAEVAVAQTCEMLALEPEAEEDYFSSRFYEINDACERVIRMLLGIQMNETVSSEPVIVVAKKLEPSDFVKFDNEKILGVVLESGEASRMRSLVRAKGFPVLVGVENVTKNVRTGETAILDGNKGILTII